MVTSGAEAGGMSVGRGCMNTRTAAESTIIQFEIGCRLHIVQDVAVSSKWTALVENAALVVCLGRARPKEAFSESPRDRSGRFKSPSLESLRTGTRSGHCSPEVLQGIVR